MAIRERTRDLGVNYVDDNWGRRFIFPITPGASLPWQASLQKFDARLEPINIVRQSVTRVASTANPSPECASDMIVVQAELLGFDIGEATIASSVSRTRGAITLAGRDRVPELAGCLNTPTMSAGRSIPFAAYTFSGSTRCDTFWSFVMALNRIASALGSLFGREPVSPIASRYRHALTMLRSERRSFPSFAECAQ